MQQITCADLECAEELLRRRIFYDFATLEKADAIIKFVRESHLRSDHEKL